MRVTEVNLSTSEMNNVGQVVFRQDDKNTQQIVANISENGTAKNLAGLTPYFNAMINGRIISKDIATITDKSQVSYILKEGFYQKLGRIEGFFSFEQNGNRESSANFTYHVIRGTCRKITQGNYIYTFEELAKVLGDIIDNQNILPLIVKIDELNAKTDGYRLETKADIKQFKEDVQLVLKAHIDSKTNPHKVTASQTGAYTQKEVDDMIESTLAKTKVRAKRVHDEDKNIWLDDKAFIKYDLKENEEFVAVKLVFSRFDQSENAAIGTGYESFTFDNQDFRLGDHYLPFIAPSGKSTIKYANISSEGVKGHEFNRTDSESRNIVLRRVVVYYKEK